MLVLGKIIPISMCTFALLFRAWHLNLGITFKNTIGWEQILYAKVYILSDE